MAILGKVDAVTCGECKHWKNFGIMMPTQEKGCNRINSLSGFATLVTEYGQRAALVTNEYFFCAKGERKDEEEC